MITRHVLEGTSFQDYALGYDAENRLVKVCEDVNNPAVCDAGETVVAQFTYDADGKRVKSVMGADTILFVGAHYEVKNGSEITKYYLAGSTRVAMRKYTIPQNMTVEYLLSDHLGSTSLTTDANGAKVLELRYKAWGEVRASWTANPTTTPAYRSPAYTYTGQYSYMDDPTTSGVTEGFGLMFYNARWYDPYLNHFSQPDSIVPTSTQGTQAWDRYAYSNNNPVRYNDPTGHSTSGDGDQGHEQRQTDPCAKYGYDSAQCRLYLNPNHTITSFDEAANQQQTGGDDCGPTSIAIAACLYDPSSCGLTGDEVQAAMEFTNLKPRFFGVPTWGNGDRMTMAINAYLPGADVTYANGTSLNDLRSNLANDSIVIVAVSWQTDDQIKSDPLHATVGHYMVAVGYDSNGFSFMDPGNGKTTPQTNNWVQTNWLDTFNSFISSGSMWIISTP